MYKYFKNLGAEFPRNLAVFYEWIIGWTSAMRGFRRPDSLSYGPVRKVEGINIVGIAPRIVSPLKNTHVLQVLGSAMGYPRPTVQGALFVYIPNLGFKA